MTLEEMQKDIQARLSPNYPTNRRDLIRFYQHRKQLFKQAYAVLLDKRTICEQGSGRTMDPVTVFAGPIMEQPNYASLMPWVTKVPRSVWVDFTARCVLAGHEPEQVVTELLGRAIEQPSISQNVDRGY
jgi:hypothetical protein